MCIVYVFCYIILLCEGGLLFVVVEIDDDGMVVLKFCGVGQGLKVLIVELIVGEMVCMLGLLILEILFVGLDCEFVCIEFDLEIQELICVSEGLNLGLDYLLGVINYDFVVMLVDVDLVLCIVWFDVFISNVDCIICNFNLMVWYCKLYLIDYGVVMYFYYDWVSVGDVCEKLFVLICDYVLLLFVSCIVDVDVELVVCLIDVEIECIVGLVLDSWLVDELVFDSLQVYCQGYISYFKYCLKVCVVFVQEVICVYVVYV